MARQMSYTGPSGAVSGMSYWVPVSMGIDLIANQAQIIWLGYNTKNDHDAGKPPIGSHTYIVTGAAFTTYVSPVLAGTYAGGGNKALDDQAMATLDTAGASFFAGSILV